MAFSALVVPAPDRARWRQARVRRNGLFRAAGGARGGPAHPRIDQGSVDPRRRDGCVAQHGDLSRPFPPHLWKHSRAKRATRRSTRARRSSAEGDTGDKLLRDHARLGPRHDRWARDQADGQRAGLWRDRAAPLRHAHRRRSPRRARRPSCASAARPSSPRCAHTPTSRRLPRRSPGNCSGSPAERPVLPARAQVSPNRRLGLAQPAGPTKPAHTTSSVLRNSPPRHRSAPPLAVRSGQYPA